MGGPLNAVVSRPRRKRVVVQRQFHQCFFAAMMAGLLVLPGCISAHAGKTVVPVAPSVIQSAERFRKEYVLAPSDQIEVNVRRMPEVSRMESIRPDGLITLPLVNDVQAAGLTPRELAEDLTKKLSARLINPEVTVIPIKVRQPVVYVVGESTAAAAIPYGEAPTAMQAITLAGGLRRSAAARNVVIIRLDTDGHLRAIPITADVNGQPGPYMALRATLLNPDDIVFIPENGRSQVTRFLNDFVNQPLSSTAAAMAIVADYRLIQLLK